MRKYEYKFLGSATAKELAWAMLEEATGIVRKPKYWDDQDDLLILVQDTDGQNPSVRYEPTMFGDPLVYGRVRKRDFADWVAEIAVEIKPDWVALYTHPIVPDTYEYRFGTDYVECRRKNV